MPCQRQQVEGIAVDTHVHRVANALGWTGSATKTAQQTRRELENRIPRQMWGIINPLVVGALGSFRRRFVKEGRNRTSSQLHLHSRALSL